MAAQEAGIRREIARMNAAGYTDEEIIRWLNGENYEEFETTKSAQKINLEKIQLSRFIKIGENPTIKWRVRHSDGIEERVDFSKHPLTIYKRAFNWKAVWIGQKAYSRLTIGG